ncbi:L-rhamnono-gamma-lactonase [Zalerion maritima]|uniref:L-rhamnono-gamma-lactonase n=1 Tax=Zalerion maritima TaxID=339359 RepID=A0AAD5RPR3_9PEZI|nr:L-rhamnono-gamma-lactonase [Zalerion maritima]
MPVVDPSNIPILDSHIHLYPESELDSLTWYTGPEHPLAQQRTPDLYKRVIAGAKPASGTERPFMGAIFVETDRKHDIVSDPPNYDGPLAELAWLRRIVEGKPKDGEGHGEEDKTLLSAIVPWAPLPLGPDAVAEYLTKAEEAAGPETWKLAKGFRYLLQDKPLGVGVEPKFIGSLKLLGKRGFAFDVGVDIHRRGKKQLEETVDMIEAAHEGVPDDEKCVFILNHLCKPDFSALHPADPQFVGWKSALYILGKNPKVYMKLSGGFAEMSDNLKRGSRSQIFTGTMPWLSTLLATFTNRIMFGSDWPVCTVGVESDEDGDQKENAWGKWRDVVEFICDMASMEKDAQERVWFGAAMEAYGIENKE